MTKIESLSSEQFKEVIQNNLSKYIALYKDGCFMGGITLHNMDNYDEIIAKYKNTYIMLHFYIGRSYLSLLVDSFEIQE